MNKEEKIRLLSAPMDEKLQRTKALIMEWYHQYDGNVYVSFSGGKDSTVLLHIVRSIFPDVVAVFADTGLEYPELKDFVKTIDNVTTIRPKMSFRQVLEKYGYPVINKEQSQYIRRYRASKELRDKGVRYKSGPKKGELRGSLYEMDIRLNGNKHGQGKISEKWKFLIDAPFKITEQCCEVFKKNPFKDYEKETGNKPIVGVMAAESSQRAVHYYKEECNAFNSKRPISKPLFFWNNDDIWKYIRDFNVEYSSIYDKGYDRTGCMFCMFGLDLDQRRVEKGELDKDRFERMKETHPKLYDYCMDKLGLRKIIKFWTGRDYE